MLAYQQKESTARVASIMENTNLSKQQQVSEIMRQMLTQAQTAGQYFTNDQIKEMTRKVSADVDLVHQQTQNQRYCFFFQAEDGIRDLTVTGVQTCALPIFHMVRLEEGPAIFLICPTCGRLQRPRLVKDGKLYLVNLTDEQMETLQILYKLNL